MIKKLIKSIGMKRIISIIKEKNMSKEYLKKFLYTFLSWFFFLLDLVLR
ncbi:protein of unknown function [Oenococcus oeni]|uniref:Uncharacterized protein n=1 Tax=Oenococcus oeni TaxID=1247 RepID=A0AAQ2UWN1_OENOE|nr:hypothetical protein OENI_10028 [Oenococcus oeni]VDB98858.1 protein of unknown function [Oenococcus oeni]